MAWVIKRLITMEVMVDIMQTIEIMVVQVTAVQTMAAALLTTAVMMVTRVQVAIRKSQTKRNVTRDQITRTTIAETTVEVTMEVAIKTTMASTKGEVTTPIRTISASPVSTRTTLEEKGGNSRTSLHRITASSVTEGSTSLLNTSRTHLQTIMVLTSSLSSQMLLGSTSTETHSHVSCAKKTPMDGIHPPIDNHGGTSGFYFFYRSNIVQADSCDIIQQ